MTGQQEPRGLMCPPTFFDVKYDINPQMGETLARGEKVDKVRAFEQWMRLAYLLQCAGVDLSYLPPHPDFPDMAFTANAGFFYGGKMIVSSFRHPERRGESLEVRSYFSEMLRIPVITPPLLHGEGCQSFFEGQGDALWYGGNTLVYGYGFRSNEKGIETVRQTVGWSGSFPLKLTKEHFYHLDTCFCPMGEDILWYPPAFDWAAQENIRRLFGLFAGRGKSVTVSKEDAMRFVANGIYLSFGGRRILITSPPTLKLRRELEKLGIEVWGNDVSEFLKSGGGNKCLFFSF